jgi:hypothetical protein
MKKIHPLVFSDLEFPYISPAWFQALPAQKCLAAAKKTDPKSDFRQVFFLDCKNPNRKNQSYDLDGTLSDLPSYTSVGVATLHRHCCMMCAECTRECARRPALYDLLEELQHYNNKVTNLMDTFQYCHCNTHI